MTTIKPNGNYIHLSVTAPTGLLVAMKEGVIHPDSTFHVLAIGNTVNLHPATGLPVGTPIVEGVRVLLRDRANMSQVDEGQVISTDDKLKNMSVLVDAGSILAVYVE